MEEGPYAEILSLDTYDFYEVTLRWWQRPGWWIRSRAIALRWWWEER